MTLLSWVAFVVPIVAALAIAAFGYRQSVNAATAIAKAGAREQAAAARGAAFSAELTRLQQVQAADEERYEIRLDGLQHQVKELEEQLAVDAQHITALEQRVTRLVAWARTVLSFLNRPDVAEVLVIRGIKIPTPPPDVQRPPNL